jgi:hypothetical protein
MAKNKGPARKGNRHTAAQIMTEQSTAPVFSDAEMTDAEPTPAAANVGRRRFVIAVDYGTTFSAVSFVILQPGETNDNITTERLHCISNYPDDPHQHRDPAKEVPTELWYLDKLKRSRGRPRKTPLPGTASASMDPIQIDDFDEYDSLFPQDPQPSTTPLQPKVYWGYQVQRQMGRPDGPDPNDAPDRHIKRAKILLDESNNTADGRVRLSRTIRYLQRQKLIKDYKDVITDFLTELLCHTKTQLERKHNFDENCDPEFVLGVPPTWEWNATSTMKIAMNTAISRAGFRVHQGQALNGLFVVSEPEAAATYFLAAGKWDEHIRVCSYKFKLMVLNGH